MVQQFLVTTF